jgi:hypothetical protein
MAVITMGNTSMDRRMGRECITGQMGQSILVSGLRMRCMEKANSFGVTAESIKALLSWE